MTVDVAALRDLRTSRPERTIPVKRLAGTLLLAGGAIAIGAAATVDPRPVLLLFAAPALVALAFLAPVTHLTLYLWLTTVVGYELQHKLGSHLLPSDALLLTGLLRGAVVLMRRRLEPRRIALLAIMTLFMLGVLLQVVHGLQAGYNSSQVGDEARDLFGFGAVLMAMPMLDDPVERGRLARGLLIVGLTLGVWGLSTWALGITLGENIDVGLRSTAEFAVSGNGQLHGGLYGYPVVVIMSAAVLLSGRGGRWRWLIAVTLAVNLVALVLTYERTFWLTTIVTLGFVVAKVGRGRRIRALAITMGTAVATIGLLATVVPHDLSKIEARILTLGQGQSDDSVRYRVVETGLVLHKVEANPITGWGLGDTLYWGQPWDQVPPKARWFSHNGYLWVAWKVGVIEALLLFGVLAWAIISRAPPDEDPDVRALRIAAQGGLLVLLLSSATFPSFNSFSITAAMGVLLAVCFMPRVPSRQRRSATATADV
jgi:O-Antigen ligase